MKKKITALLLAMSMALALAACGGGNPGTPSSTGSNPSTPSTGSGTSSAGGDVIKAVYCASMNNESQAFAYKMF